MATDAVADAADLRRRGRVGWMVVTTPSSARPRGRGGGADRLDDVHVAGAAAEVAGDRPADLVVGRVGVLARAAPCRPASSPACRTRTAARARR